MRRPWSTSSAVSSSFRPCLAATRLASQRARGLVPAGTARGLCAVLQHRPRLLHPPQQLQPGPGAGAGRSLAAGATPRSLHCRTELGAGEPALRHGVPSDGVRPLAAGRPCRAAGFAGTDRRRAGRSRLGAAGTDRLDRGRTGCCSATPPRRPRRPLLRQRQIQRPQRRHPKAEADAKAGEAQAKVGANANLPVAKTAVADMPTLAKPTTAKAAAPGPKLATAPHTPAATAARLALRHDATPRRRPRSPSPPLVPRTGAAPPVLKDDTRLRPSAAPADRPQAKAPAATDTKTPSAPNAVAAGAPSPTRRPSPPSRPRLRRRPAPPQARPEPAKPASPEGRRPAGTATGQAGAGEARRSAEGRGTATGSASAAATPPSGRNPHAAAGRQQGTGQGRGRDAARRAGSRLLLRRPCSRRSRPSRSSRRWPCRSRLPPPAPVVQPGGEAAADDKDDEPKKDDKK